MFSGKKQRKEAMAERAVIFLLGKLEPLFTTEVKLLSDVRAEVEYIKDKLELMQAFLRVADANEENDPVLQVWVKQVRDVACDIEDVIDEFNLHLARQHASGFYASFDRIYCSIKNLKTRHQIASEIKGNRSRMVSISEEYNKYQNERGSSSTSASITRENSLMDTPFLGKADHPVILGINKPKSQIIEWLLRSDSKRTVVSVVGMGGLAETTLVKQVYGDASVKKRFKIYVWLTVPQSFKIRESFQSLGPEAHGVIKKPVPEEVDRMDINELKEVIGRLLQRSRHPIVLDDVWNLNAWDAIESVIPDNNLSSRIMLTTRRLKVTSASSKLSHGEIYELRALV